jgi:predicted outer membrane lipoprotein
MTAEEGTGSRPKMTQLRIEVSGSQDVGLCECCGAASRTVWGYVYRGDDAEAAYFVQWTLGQVLRHGANFDLIVGKWGEGADRNDRGAVSLEFRRADSGPAFMIIDSIHRPVGSSDLAGRSLARSEVMGTPLATAAFEIVDAIWLQDERIAEIVNSAYGTQRGK